MKIAFVGKGGSGKTTLSSLFMRFLSAENNPVLAIDADINQHLDEALGFGGDEKLQLPPMGIEIDRIKKYVRGSNSLIRSESEMVKTTPPGRGSRLLKVNESNDLYEYFAYEHDGIKLMATGPFTEEDLGVKCYHSKTGAAELLLNHLHEDDGEYVVVDMTAGADSFASGMFTRFDTTFIVVEPTRKSINVYEQYKQHADGYYVNIKVIGNKIEDSEDEDFIRQYAKDDYTFGFSRSRYVKLMERGDTLSLEGLEENNISALKKMKETVDSTGQNWQRFYEQAVHFHRKNAESWANASVGADVTGQIDPEFSFPKR